MTGSGDAGESRGSGDAGDPAAELLEPWQIRSVYQAPNPRGTTMALTAEQIAAYDRDGFVAIDPFVDAADVVRIATIYDELFDRTHGHGDLDLVSTGDAPPVIPQILGPAAQRPELITGTQAAANARAIAIQLLGPDALLEFDHAISKPPRSRAETPWHQDEAYWHPELDYRALSIWIALQDVDESNGCMSFVPGSHRRPVLPHRHLGEGGAAHGLEIVPGSTDLGVPVSCPLRAGGATVHHSRTLHATSANVTDRTRRAYILVASTPPQRLPLARDFPWAGH